ncbi:MAG TPA: hypothetical protein VL175_01455 [Pirellulales bacterium]|jgi:hypothetical protein|nr:hypothetical protein [Pirellulales bacterium]
MNKVYVSSRSLWRALCGACLLAVLGMSATARADEDLESNLKLMPVGSFTGTLPSVALPAIYGDNLETGPITLSLDTNQVNLFGLDNVLQQGHIEVTLLLSSPLFDFLHITPSIRIVETGPAYVNFPGTENFVPEGADFTFVANLTGGGTITQGLFAGTTFHNLNAYEGDGVLGSWLVMPNSIVTWNIAGDGSITFPDGTVVNGVSGSGFLGVAPEPSSFVLGSMGMLLLAAALRRRARPT